MSSSEPRWATRKLVACNQCDHCRISHRHSGRIWLCLETNYAINKEDDPDWIYHNIPHWCPLPKVGE